VHNTHQHKLFDYMGMENENFTKLCMKNYMRFVGMQK
jgi:hypothetical protein